MHSFYGAVAVLAGTEVPALTADRNRYTPQDMAAPEKSIVRIVPVEGPVGNLLGNIDALETVRLLLQEYWNSFGFTPCFQNFGDELAGLPGAYVPPSGRLALATVDGQPAGCVALRRVDTLRAEPKRLYVRPAFRGHGLGRSLLEWVMNEARAAGYRELVGDTMPVMEDALALYDRMGFERAGVGAPVQTSPFSQIAAEPILIRIKL
jgi:putative acetyltransferase